MSNAEYVKWLGMLLMAVLKWCFIIIGALMLLVMMGYMLVIIRELIVMLREDRLEKTSEGAESNAKSNTRQEQSAAVGRECEENKVAQGKQIAQENQASPAQEKTP